MNKKFKIQIQARVAPSLLATPLTYLVKDGFQYKTKSQLVEDCLDLLCRILDTNIGIKRIEDEEAALRAIELYFKGETTITADRVTLLNKITTSEHHKRKSRKAVKSAPKKGLRIPYQRD